MSTYAFRRFQESDIVGTDGNCKVTDMISDARDSEGVVPVRVKEGIFVRGKGR